MCEYLYAGVIIKSWGVPDISSKHLVLQVIMKQPNLT